MSTAASTGAVRTWWLAPRDPLVFGDGARVPALVPRRSFLLPPQCTLAGMVRTRLAGNRTDVGPDAARALLEVRIRGPWLAEQRRDGEPPALWLPVPCDYRVRSPGGAPCRPGRLVLPGEDEGTLGPLAAGDDLVLVEIEEKTAVGEKTRPPRFPFWPFEKLLAWGLDEPGWEPPADLGLRELGPIAAEDRVHVAIDDEAQTAEPEALFSTGGLRFDRGFGLALEVRDGRASPGSAGPVPGGRGELLVLGAESRTVECQLREGACFPAFADFEDRYARHLERLRAEARENAEHEIGLRLQLLTPGAFGGWEPRWPAALIAGLRAVVLSRPVPVSGWNLQAGGPRKVRRLVPAGSAYFVAVHQPERLLETCRALWGASLATDSDGGDLPGDPSSFLASPAADGYGQVLPIPCLVPRSVP